MAGFVTRFVAVGMASYVVGAFLIPMTEEFGWGGLLPMQEVIWITFFLWGLFKIDRG